MAVLRRFLQVISAGFILMYFSENLFWARWRPGNSVLDSLYTWTAYSLMAFVFLWIVSYFRVRSFWTLFLAGAVFGWLCEGVVVQTTYEMLPLSISFTGLAWHAAISVMAGWYLVRNILQDNRPWKTVKTASLIGFIYGLWAIFWWIEPDDGGKATILQFALFSFITNILAILAYMLNDWASVKDFVPGRASKIIVSCIALAQFALVTAPKAPVSLAVLPLLLLLAYIPLKRNRDSNPDGSFLSAKPAKVAFWNYLLLLFLPLTATVFYSLAYLADLKWHTNIVLYIITTPLGFVLFALSCYHTLKSRKTI